MSATEIYVEGGGDTRSQQAPYRMGFSNFFGKIFPDGKKPKIVACGGRWQAYHDFKVAFENNNAENIILLVDSEQPVNNAPWDHVRRREEDNWPKPNNASDENLYFMTECMENWFFAHKEILVQYYGDGFLGNSLPARLDIENISKSEVIQSLKNATRNTQKRAYKKNHAFDILSLIDPYKLNNANNSPQAHRLISFIENLP